MKDFAARAGRLRSLPLPARLVYSIFLVFTAMALGLSLLLADAMVGADLNGIDSYYAGRRPDPTPVAAEAHLEDSGPEIDLPVEEERYEPEPMSTRKLLEVTHFHLFSMPLYLMVLSHLYMLSRQSNRQKILWIVLATIGTAVHLVAPWVARTHGQSSAWLYGGSGVLLLLSYAIMIVVPLFEMWTPGPSGRR
ncbi:MAG: hypothetical protein R3A47_10385 [Polyangiales bacterium]